MIIRICAFTQQGKILLEKLSAKWEDAVFQERPMDMSLGDWTEDCFRRRLPILFVGAAGIAVRAIAPFVRDKLEDSPVLVADERGNYFIPILSGHMGGANRLAQKMADLMGAKAVLTTATDVEGFFSVDVFADRQGFDIVDREGIRKISAKVLRGERIRTAVEPCIFHAPLPAELEEVPFGEGRADLTIYADRSSLFYEDRASVLRLVAKPYILGIGCKKGKSFEDILEFMSQHCPCDLSHEISAIATIDLKKREEGLWGVAQYLHIPIFFYSARELSEVLGSFSESEFVREVTGVSNVCERAALCCAGEGGSLVQKKCAGNGVTLAIARRETKITGWSG